MEPCRQPLPNSTEGFSRNRPARFGLGGSRMPRLPSDIERSLRTDQFHIRASTARISRGRYVHDEMHSRIRASIAFIERAGAIWSTKPPILPMPSGISLIRRQEQLISELAGSGRETAEAENLLDLLTTALHNFESIGR